MDRFLSGRVMAILKRMLWGAAVVALIVGLWRLEAERATVTERQITTAVGDVSLYQGNVERNGPLVFVAHGFAGSRQMMQYISRDLARAGFTVAAFDFYGQGRSAGRMSADVTRIEGTTLQLVAQTRAVVDAVRAQTGLTGPVALLGHSMATDIIIRAAQELPDHAAVVAISMYSDAVTADFPPRLLVLSGEWEARLRDVGRRAVALVGGIEVEGETVASDGVIRRAVFVPGTEHVAVLFSPVTMAETRAWLQAAFGIEPDGQAWAQGGAIVMTLAALVVLIWPLAQVLPKRNLVPKPLPKKWYFAAISLPVLPAFAAPLLVPASVSGTAAFGSLIAFFAAWGVAALGVLVWKDRSFSVLIDRSSRPDGHGAYGALAALMFVVWALGVFAVALDRYAAAFVPVGPRFDLMLWLIPATVPFMLVDRLIVAGAALWQRVLARLVPIVVLTVSMITHPDSMGLLFTVLPVMVLFYLVYGTMARPVEKRAGPMPAGLAMGVVLAWSIAASTPLFAV